MPAHQPLDPAAADPMTLGAQSGMHAWAAIATLMLTMEPMHLVQQAPVRYRPMALRPGAPGVIAAGRDLEHAAHEPHRIGAGMLLDEVKPHLGISAKMPMAS
jgi:hypothetical protein